MDINVIKTLKLSSIQSIKIGFNSVILLPNDTLSNTINLMNILICKYRIICDKKLCRPCGTCKGKLVEQ